MVSFSYSFICINRLNQKLKAALFEQDQFRKNEIFESVRISSEKRSVKKIPKEVDDFNNENIQNIEEISEKPSFFVQSVNRSQDNWIKENSEEMPFFARNWKFPSPLPESSSQNVMHLKITNKNDTEESKKLNVDDVYNIFG